MPEWMELSFHSFHYNGPSLRGGDLYVWIHQQKLQESDKQGINVCRMSEFMKHFLVSCHRSGAVLGTGVVDTVLIRTAFLSPTPRAQSSLMTTVPTKPTLSRNKGIVLLLLPTNFSGLCSFGCGAHVMTYFYFPRKPLYLLESFYFSVLLHLLFYVFKKFNFLNV